MSKPKQMFESLVEEIPFETVPVVKYDTAALSEMTEEARKKEGLPPGAIMVFEAKIFHAGKVTANGRLYHTPLMRAETARLNEDIKDRRVKGLAGHPAPDQSPDPSRTCLVPLGLWMEEDGSGHMKAAVPDTSKGRDLAALARMGVKVGFSIRGRGRSSKVEMNDKHPCYQGNEHWAGKQIEDVRDHYRLDAPDWVDNQAVHDAELSNYHESEDEPVDFKIENLTEDQWKTILESDKVKGVVADATKAVTVDHVKQLAEGDELAKLLVGNDALVKGLAKNETFTKALAEEFDDGEPEPEPEVAKVECTTCKKDIVEGSTFCAVCGARQVTMTEGQEPDQPADAKDKAINDLTEANQKLTERLDKVEADKKAVEDKATCDEAIAEAIQDKAAPVQSGVRKFLESKELTPDNVADEIKGAVEFVEGLVGNELPADDGKGKAQPADDQLGEEDNTRQVAEGDSETGDLLESQELQDNLDAIDV